LLLGENSDGLIVHWELFEDVRSDSRLLLGALEVTKKPSAQSFKKSSQTVALVMRRSSGILPKTTRPSLITSARASHRSWPKRKATLTFAGMKPAAPGPKREWSVLPKFFWIYDFGGRFFGGMRMGSVGSLLWL
jgi:hypothetical protein